MSAPILSPLDSPIFDEDVIAEMEERAHDGITCMLHLCPESPGWQLIARCCGDRRFICDRHLVLARANWADVVAGRASKCGSCGEVQIGDGSR